MATLNPARAAYTLNPGSSATGPQWGPNSIYIAYNKHMGLFEFTTSINSLLGTSASSWSELKFTKAEFYVTVSSPFVKGSSSTTALKISDIQNYFSIAAGLSIIKKGDDLGTDYTSWQTFTMSSSSANANSSKFYFPLGDFFSNINVTNFTPNTTKWYLAFKTNNSNISYRSSYNHISSNVTKTVLTLEGEQYSPIKVYKNSTFVSAEPYVYKNGDFVPVTSKIYKNNTFN